MRIAIVVAVVAALLVVTSSLHAEDPDAPPTPATFPETFRGHWKGACAANQVAGKSQTFNMELRVEPIEGKDAWTWEITYGEGDKKQVRPYEILPVDAAKGHYVVDEKNSIKIDAHAVGDVLCSRFWVSNAVIDASYRLAGEDLVVTLTTFGGCPRSHSLGSVTLTGDHCREGLPAAELLWREGPLSSSLVVMRDGA